MTITELCRTLNLPSDLTEQILECQNNRTEELPEEIKKKLFERSAWESGIAELKEFLGEDPYSMKILLEQMLLVCSYTYEEYVKRGISREVFVDTFGFIPRFVIPTGNSEGKYSYNWAWWLPREITLQEYRIGALEYEFVKEGDERRIEVHIPSDADMKIEALCRSVVDFLSFEKEYFPDWEGVRLCTDTWMIMPQLDKFLADDSKILRFKGLFDIENVDFTQTWYMGWIFPGFTQINDELPENTSLQRNLKKYLLEGNKFGVAQGTLILDRVYDILEKEH